MDILIAGCAKANNLTLVTNNTKEFKRVNDDFFGEINIKGHQPLASHLHLILNLVQ